MKARILYGGIVCITFIFTLLVFRDFQRQRRTSDVFQQVIYSAPLNMRYLLIAPEQVKVENWQVGDSSVYRLKTNAESRQISFHVAARDAKRENQFWLKMDGFLQFNDVEIEFWRLLDKTNLRPGSETRGFFFSHNGIPFPTPPVKFLSNPVALEKLGDEVVETPIGALKCEHVLAYIHSPDGELLPLLELWTNPAIRPLGLVRARWRDAFLDLVAANTNNVSEIPWILLSEFDRDTPLDGSCSRCHADGIGETDLKLESIDWLSGTKLNLTTGLFHSRQAKIVEPGDLITIQLTEASQRARKQALVRFSWEKGSFWIKPNERSQLRLSLDAIAHQSNIILESSIGRLDLDLRK